MAECMHGFDEGMCDICFPRKAAEPPVTMAATATRTAPRVTAPPRVRARLTERPAGAPPKLPPFGSRRLYHVTHARNLEAILLEGGIKALSAGADPDVDIAAPVIRQLRATTNVGDGRMVADFVPFALSPGAGWWSELREGAPGARWSAAARLTSPAEYVALVVAAERIGPDVVIAEGDSSAPATHFMIGEPARNLAIAVRKDPELAAVEVLVAERVPLEAVVLLGVPNEPMRTRVRRMFEAVDQTPPKIVVHPPWFLPADA
jgi:ssDNA thymidine ADP-ribosyltransferase DarT-like protein